MPQISADISLRRNPDLIATDVGGETVIMSVEWGEYHGIGGGGSRGWELLEKPITMREIVQSICDDFGGDEQTCQADMKAFVETFRQNNLLSVG